MACLSVHAPRTVRNINDMPPVRWLPAAVLTGCGYEDVAIVVAWLRPEWAKYVPTITELDRRSRHVIGATLLIAGAWHFFMDDWLLPRVLAVQDPGEWPR